MTEYELSQTVESANSPETIALRNEDDEVPPGVSAYRIDRVVATDQSSAQNDVTIENYDDDDANIDSSVTVSVAADETETLGTETDSPILTVPRGNQIRVSDEGDADVTIYIIPDDF